MEFTAVVLEPTHSNPFLIWCLSGKWLLVLPPISSPVSLTDMCILSTPPKALAWSCWPALMFSTFRIIFSKVPVRRPPTSFTGVFMGWGGDSQRLGLLSSVHGPYQGLMMTVEWSSDAYRPWLHKQLSYQTQTTVPQWVISKWVCVKCWQKSDTQ